MSWRALQGLPMHFFGEALAEQIWAYALGAGRPHPA